MSRPLSPDKRLLEAKIDVWIRKNTSRKKEFWFSTRDLFDGIGLDYDNKNDYRAVMGIIHQWRRQAPFFYNSMIQMGELNGETIYENFEDFLKDFNDIPAYFLWNKTVEAKDGKIIYGYYQPIDAEQKIKIDNKRNGKTIKQLKRRVADMILMRIEKLPSGISPMLAFQSLERYEQRYLLPPGSPASDGEFDEAKEIIKEKR